MSASSRFLGSHAIVIGGGMAGLLSAHVLSSHFERVSLIERDHYPEGPLFRAGTPQGRHVHIMLVRGQQILETFFPGIKDKLVAQGAVTGDFGADYVYSFAPGIIPGGPSDLRGYACSRVLLEWQVRQEVMARGRVRVIDQHRVVNMLTSADRRTVTGVQMQERSNTAPANSETIDLSADLVVDASGRDSQVVSWLEALGYPPQRKPSSMLFWAMPRACTLRHRMLQEHGKG